MPRFKDGGRRKGASDAALLAAAEARLTRNKLICEAVAAGDQQEDVAERFGLDQSTISIISRAGSTGVPPVTGNAGTEACVAARKLRRASGLPNRPHPATGDPGYSDEESAYLTACEAFRSSTGRKFMLATDYLHVLRTLGYAKA